MFPSYHDVTSRISELPSWYTQEGYPRYGEFAPGLCNIYCRYSVLFEVACQYCDQRFNIGVDVTEHSLIRFAVDFDIFRTYNTNPFIPPDLAELWLSLEQSLYVPMLKLNGQVVTKRIPIEEFVNGWALGDPPSHGCVGDTMSSITVRTVQVWDRQHGRAVEDGIIKVWGEEARIPELEDLDLTDEWYEKNRGWMM